MGNIVEVTELIKRFGATTAVNNLTFSVGHGQCLSLLGPSGCGKTTTLRIIAGFEKLDQGAVFIDGQDVSQHRPYERKIGLVFQDYALFPHMNVEQNVTYGMRYRGVDKEEVPQRLRDVLALVKLSGFEKRRPQQLSGGEQQRVALARALATQPAVLLLDEPLSNLDARLREQVRVELREILAAAGTTTIIVTHDQQEAMSIADVVIVMNKGRLMQMGTPTEIYARPSNKFVADFIGKMNWFHGEPCDTTESEFRAFQTNNGLHLLVPDREMRAGAAYDVGVRPERIAVESDSAAKGCNRADGEVIVSGRIAAIEHLGADIHLWIEIGLGRRILAIEKNVGAATRRNGELVNVRFEAADCLVLPADGAAEGEPWD